MKHGLWPALCVFGGSGLLLLSMGAQAPPALRKLDFEPAAVSADGSVVVGGYREGSWPGEIHAVRWTSSGGARVVWPGPNGWASAVSADGSQVFGNSEGFALRWTEPTGPAPLFPGSESGSSVTDVSADGSVIVGEAEGPYRWTARDGAMALPGGDYVHAISGDGRVAVGSRLTIIGMKGVQTHALRWSENGGPTEFPPLPPDAWAVAIDVSADGTVVVGHSSPGDFRPGTDAVRWVGGGPAQDLGDIPGSSGDWAVAVSADGSVIVGQSVAPDDWRPFLWDASRGMRRLDGVLADLGVDVAGWQLDSVTGLSADGRTVIGIGRDPSGRYTGWVATVPEVGMPRAVYLVTAALLTRRRRRRRPASATRVTRLSGMGAPSAASMT